MIVHSAEWPFGASCPAHLDTLKRRFCEPWRLMEEILSIGDRSTVVAKLRSHEGALATGDVPAAADTALRKDDPHVSKRDVLQAALSPGA